MSLIFRMRSPRLFVAAGLVVAAALLGCMSNALVGLLYVSVKMGEPIALRLSSRSMGWGFVSHPYIYEVLPGMVVLTYNLAGDTVGATPPAELKNAGPAVTTDGGANWEFGTNALWNRFGGAQLPLGCVIKTTNGIVLLSSLETKWDQHFGKVAWMRDGKLAEGPSDVVCTTTTLMYNVCVSPDGVQLPSGDLAFVGFSTVSGKFSTILFKSSDGGRTFAGSVIASIHDAPWGWEGPCEPALALVAGGRLLCVARTGGNPLLSNPMLIMHSDDEGKTWQGKRRFYNGVRPIIRRLADGTLVCLFGRPGNSMTFSVDEGKTWGAEIAITPASIKTSGYVDAVEVSPGRLLVAYDVYDTTMSKFWLWEPPEPINAIFYRYVEVKRR
ncbi:MAG TPA: sialidase family protein [Kiritimatiellia bacterium]